MIFIDDTDSPITVADKIINGKRPYNPTVVDVAISKLIKEDVCNEVQMFNLDEIKEIADYLLVYYIAHLDENDGENEE